MPNCLVLSSSCMNFAAIGGNRRIIFLLTSGMKL